ncbi:MAG: MBL fold metallo-hydrolase [Clostridia bacterium]|nr:MBL fold metallo-hydrolase [Clostridia bacterium]
MKRHITGNVSWIGYIDWELKQFHGDDYAIQHGSSQNAYVVEEEKTVLIDTVWAPHKEEYLDNLAREIDLSKADAVIANHGEPDHSSGLPDLMERLPEGTPIYCTANGVRSLKGQYGDRGWNFQVVKTGDRLDVGNGKELIFVEMRMLHWPDSMATYLTGDNILFSMDAFGQHYAVEELFADRADEGILLGEAMKYYANILNPFSPLVKAKLKEIGTLDLPFAMIAPSHGAIWRDHPEQIIDLYAKWSDDFQEDQVTIVYDTMWGGTEKLAHALSVAVSEASPDTKVKVFNINKTDKNTIATEIFRSKAVAVGSPTVGQDILSGMTGFLAFIRQLKFKKKKAGVFGTYGWSGESVAVLSRLLTDSGFTVVGDPVKVNWFPHQEALDELPALAQAMLA